MTTAARVMGMLGIVTYFGVGWLYLGSGLVMPEPWFYVMWIAWLAGWVVQRVYRSRAIWTPVVAVGAVVFWVTVVLLGNWLLGWTP